MILDNDLVVIGDAFIDIIVPVNNTNKGGVFQKKITIQIGGLANVAIWAARQNVKAAFIGKVGNDCQGKLYSKKLAAEGVTPFLSISKDKPTGICVSLVHDDKDRTMIINRNANDRLMENNIPIQVFEKSDYTYISGYSFQSKNLQNVFLYIMKEAPKYETKMVFNGGSYNIIEKNIDRFLEIIKNHVDILILNYDEALTLTKASSLQSAFERLKKISPKYIITLGDKGAMGFDGEKEIKSGIEPVKHLIDTTGAGDAFSGGFIASLINGEPFKESMQLGHELARRAIQKTGAT
jgi:sugar/nucleoside kinase (ribokinase family)